MMLAQQEESTHMNRAAIVIPATGPITSLHQALAPREVVLKTSFAEKTRILEISLEFKVVEKRGENLAGTFESIAQICATIKMFEHQQNLPSQEKG